MRKDIPSTARTDKIDTPNDIRADHKASSVNASESVIEETEATPILVNNLFINSYLTVKANKYAVGAVPVEKLEETSVSTCNAECSESIVKVTLPIV